MIRHLVWSFALALPVLAAAQVPDPGSDPQSFVNMLLGAIANGQWRLLAILIAVVVVFVLRQFASRIPGKVGIFFASARGGAVLALLGGVVTALSGLLVKGGPITAGLIVNGFALGVTAAGGWNIVRRLIWGDAAPDLYPKPQAPTP